MLIKRRFLDGIVDGSVDLQFRRWQRPMAKVGGTMRTAVGVLEVLGVEVVDAATLTPDDARRAGCASVAATLAESIGRDRDSFKLDVRKLKNLGLTESLQTGYRISPRGLAVLHHISTPPG